MAIPDDHERDDDKDEKFTGGGRVDCPPTPGLLAQTGTLDPSVARRTKHPLSANLLHDLAEPTLLVPASEGPQPPSLTTTTTTIPRGFLFDRIKIALVATSLTPCQLVAVGMRGGAYGLGRDENSQLGYLSLSSSLSEGVEGESKNNNMMIPLPHPLTGPFVTNLINILGAATVKGRTILINAGGLHTLADQIIWYSVVSITS